MRDCNTAGMNVPSATVWERDTTPGPHGYRTWLIGGATALCGFGAFAAFMAEDPGQIPFFVVCWFVLVGAVFLYGYLRDRMRRQHPTVSLVGDELQWAARSVKVDDVTSWTVHITTQTVYNGTTTSRTSRMVARFTTDDEMVEFGWGAPRDGEVEALQAALRPILPEGEKIFD